MFFDISDDALFIHLSFLLMISAQKDRSTPVAVLRVQTHDRITKLAKSNRLHGGALVDFSSGLTHRNVAPQ